jgi:prepilin-type N-terminal cleavage/methylation domain-containing protein
MKMVCLDSSGFTLMEIMLATIILAMVVSMVTVSLSGSLKVVAATRDQGDLYYRAQIVLERICEDLESAVLTADSEFIAASTDGSNQKQVVVDFMSLAHVAFDPEGSQDGIARIQYGVMPDPDNGEQLVLLRSDQLLTPQDEEGDEEFAGGFMLSDRLRAFTLSYFDLEGEEFDSWDTRVEDDADDEDIKLKRRLPAAVSCRLEFWLDREEEISLTFQTMVNLPVGMVMPQVEE